MAPAILAYIRKLQSLLFAWQTEVVAIKAATCPPAATIYRAAVLSSMQEVGLFLFGGMIPQKVKLSVRDGSAAVVQTDRRQHLLKHLIVVMAQTHIAQCQIRFDVWLLFGIFFVQTSADSYC